MSKVRWAQWFWADWSNDSALNLCSIPAQGLWMRLLCLMAQGEPYGSLTVKGRIPTDDEVFQLTCPRGTRRRDFDRWLAELKHHGVAHVDHSGTTVSPRMNHDGAISLARIDAAHASWQTKANSRNPRNLHEQNPGNGADLHEEKSLLHEYLSKQTHKQKDSPSPTPTPASGGGASRGDLLSVVQNASRPGPVPAGGAPRQPFRVVAGADR